MGLGLQYPFAILLSTANSNHRFREAPTSSGRGFFVRRGGSYGNAPAPTAAKNTRLTGSHMSRDPLVRGS